MSLLLNTAFISQRRSLLGTVLRIVRDRETAEDLAQEAYLRARKAAEKGPIENVEPFLHQTARNLALDHVRRRRTRERYEDASADAQDVENIAADCPSIETKLIERERVRLFEEVMQALPERARRAWALSFLEGWSYASIAEHLGVSRNTVYNDVKLVMGHCHDALARMDR
ncbi:sigma-70 family RNA polymerase sigma factor [Starkeya sp. ORNL1]|uniref:RNA polymerase sigma factor n=1 Tax=Starkeya sp. ORNL1 TaxID=2709380 RepID=UPI0014641236|nr:sigma-70 family RNA polymerase sigma factor [Starkeya sp. ORNL1]QJP16865.1 sigma-70 family RNA polymerase sigma factor [Starkeya sp. ORNL1]